MIVQLDPMIPVYVVERKGFQYGEAMAFALIDYSQEHSVIWGCAFDDGGQVWWVPNEFIRLLINSSLGRIQETK